MKITKVTSNSISRLINAYKSMVESSEKMTFSSKSNEFFENTEISLFLSDVKGIELITLRKFCPSLILIDDNGNSFLDTPKQITNTVLRPNMNKNESDVERERSLQKLSEKLPSLLKYILGKNDNVDETIYNMFDIGSYRFKVIARFEGVNIVSLLNAFPEYLLFDERKKAFVDEGTKAFENVCGQQFVKNFYSYMESMLGAFDVLTDVRFNEEFLKYTSADVPCVCTHIRNPFIEIKMNDYSSSQELLRDIKSLKVESGFNSYKLNTDKDLIYHFAISGSIDTLIKFLSLSNLVYYYDDLKTIAGTESEFSIPSYLTPENALVYSDAIKALDKWRLDAFKQLSVEEKSEIKNNPIHYSKLELYNFIPRGSRLRFMIRGNKKDIEEFINDIKVNRSNIYNNELKDILDKIETQFKLIDTIFNMI